MAGGLSRCNEDVGTGWPVLVGWQRGPHSPKRQYSNVFGLDPWTHLWPTENQMLLSSTCYAITPITIRITISHCREVLIHISLPLACESKSN